MTDSTMTLSIITINYNNITGLRNTIDSVLYQTWKDFEWIFIDGGSTDGSKELIEKTASDCPNVSYWCSEPDRGVYNAQNKGIAQARGEYMNFMNSGDVFVDNKVLENVFSKEHTADLVYGDWLWGYPEGDRLAECPHSANMATFYCGNINHQAMFIRSSILKEEGYDESYKIYADWARWMKMACEGKSFEYVPYLICRYEMGGLSAQLIERQIIELTQLRSIPEPHIRATLEDYKNMKDMFDRYDKDWKFRHSLELIKDRPMLSKFFHLEVSLLSVVARLTKKQES